ncbi:hypothetical protein [Alteribacillus sp. HJP-4]|uniref:hypothetical protein n=1 Tax=Alteribacillus sp. HJP-4 TaxID=2775394 RepID=UPI0035CCDB8A
MKFIIDHSMQLIHRTPYAGDLCNFQETPLLQREGSHDESYINKLIKEKKYERCDYCK